MCFFSGHMIVVLTFFMLIGDVLFYRDKEGRATRRPADQYRLKATKSQ